MSNENNGVEQEVILSSGKTRLYPSFGPISPCPFCGQTPDPEDGDFCYPITRPDQEGRQVWRAGCIEVAGGCGDEVTGWSAEEAVAAWQRRV